MHERLTFGQALEEMKRGASVAMRHWAVGRTVELSAIPEPSPYFVEWGIPHFIERGRNTDTVVHGWLPGAAEILSETWFVVSKGQSTNQGY